jgi:MerR family transcriptional regulator, repressor of the yfmOP operon
MTENAVVGGYLQIGEAAERAQLTQRTLRYYEEKGLLHPPTRMDGGFRLYSSEDMERIDRIRQLKDLLGFSLADIKEMLESDDVRLQIRAEWRRDADTAEKAAKMRQSREVTLQQLNLLEQKMTKMAEMRTTLTERLQKYDAWIGEWEKTTPGEANEAAAGQSAPLGEGAASTAT